MNEKAVQQIASELVAYQKGNDQKMDQMQDTLLQLLAQSGKPQQQTSSQPPPVQQQQPAPVHQGPVTLESVSNQVANLDSRVSRVETKVDNMSDSFTKMLGDHAEQINKVVNPEEAKWYVKTGIVVLGLVTGTAVGVASHAAYDKISS